jgi:hypothetical protein
VSFVGEPGIDIGGLSRDLASEFFKEINSAQIGLFIPTTNSRNNVENFRNSFIPSPNPRIKNFSNLYNSVGALLAIGLRTGLIHPFLFPPLFWCFLSGNFITEEHLFEIDHEYQRLIEQMREMALAGREAFDTVFPNLATISNYRGEQVKVNVGNRATSENCTQFISQCHQIRISELQKHLELISRGFWNNLGFDCPSFVTPDFLESFCCSEPVIELEQLK